MKLEQQESQEKVMNRNQIPQKESNLSKRLAKIKKRKFKKIFRERLIMAIQRLKDEMDCSVMPEIILN